MQYVKDEASYRVSKLIDQLMADENTPLLTEDDRDWLKEADSYRLDALHAAVDTFNGDEEKNDEGESTV